MKAKRIFSISLACLLICGLVSSCALLSGSKKEKTFTSDDGKYSVTATGWADLDGELNDVATLEVGRLTDEQYLIVIPDAQEDLDMNFEEFTEIVVENMASSVDNAELGESEALEINGMNAFCTPLSGSIESLKAQYWLYTVETSEDYVQILTWTLKSKADENEDTLRTVATSFQEIKE